MYKLYITTSITGVFVCTNVEMKLHYPKFHISFPFILFICKMIPHKKNTTNASDISVEYLQFFIAFLENC